MKKQNNNPFYLLWLGLRATIFWIGLIGITVLAGLVVPILYLLPSSIQYKVLLAWPYFNIWLLKVVCGVRYEVRGLENINIKQNAIILSNHQSTWETMFIPTLFPSK
jgi:1-acyl-sn-glycerol-3-phosphate acyltransferase